MQTSVFTKIINGEIPCHKVFEDERTFAFMDIDPVQPGMVLVVPKTQIDRFEDLSDEDLIAVMLTVKKITLAMRKAFVNKDRIGLQIEGFEVPHAHVKLIPINSGEEFHNPPSGNDPDHKKLADQAEMIRSKL